MYKYFVSMYTGYCGSDGHDVVESDVELSEEDCSLEAWEMAVQHAAAYGYELCSNDCEDDDCDMEHPDNTNIEGSMVPYVPEKHDMHLPPCYSKKN